MEEYPMNRFNSIFTLLFFCIFTSWQATIVMAHPTDQETSQGNVKINEYDDTNYSEDDDFDLIMQQEAETSLNLNRWQRFKRWVSDKYNETKVITSSVYNYKIKPFAKKHKKAIITGTTSAATLLAAYLMYRKLIATKPKNPNS